MQLKETRNACMGCCFVVRNIKTHDAIKICVVNINTYPLLLLLLFFKADIIKASHILTMFRPFSYLVFFLFFFFSCVLQTLTVLLIGVLLETLIVLVIVVLLQTLTVLVIVLLFVRLLNPEIVYTFPSRSCTLFPPFVA